MQQNDSFIITKIKKLCSIVLAALLEENQIMPKKW
jgi:hypothetical protein